MTLHWIDWAIIAAYCALTVLIGLYFSKRSSRSMADYFVSGRSLPWWLLGTSMIATTFAADTPLAVTSYIRNGGIYDNWFWFSWAVGQLLVVFFFSRFWRRAEVVTDNELIEMRYSGKPAAVLRGFKAALFATVYNFIVLGWVLAAIATVSRVVLGISEVKAVIIFSAITLVYCTMGGLWAVAVTDVIQFVIAMAGMVILSVYAVSAVGGLGNLREAVSATQHMKFMPPMEGGVAFGTPFFNFLIFILITWWASHNADGGGYLIQRMAAAKDERHARLGMLWFVIGMYAVRLWPWVLVAAVSLVIFPTINDPAMADLGEQAAFPMVMMAVLKHPGLLGLVMTVFIAAFMSTIDTHLNWGSSYIINDIYRRFLVKDARERHYVIVAYISNVVILAVAGVLSLYIGTIERAWEFVRLMGCGVGAILIVRWFWWRINAWTEISALATSLGLTVGFEAVALVQHWGSYELFKTPATFAGVTWEFAPKSFVIIAVSLAAAVTATFLTRPVSRKRLVEFYRLVRPGGAWGTIAKEAGVPSAGLSWRGIFGWLASIGFIYCLTFGIGKLLFGPTWLGVGLLAASCAFAIPMWRMLRE